jgi:hypothetical protein
MFITKKHIPRRTFLRGVGVTLALPLLDVMLPAQTPLRQTPANQQLPRFMGIWHPMGASPGYWSPTTEGKDFEFSYITKPLEPYRNYVTLITGLDATSSFSSPEEPGGDHARSAAFLAGARPRRNAVIPYLGVTVDQHIAQKIGRETLLPSMQVGCEDAGSNTGVCNWGYSCAYTNSISWSAPTEPLPTEINPRVVFERLFGDGSTVEARTAGRRTDGSILDSVTHELTSFQKKVGAGDRAKIDSYLENIREIERRLQNVTKNTQVDAPTAEVPFGVPESYDDRVKLMYDLTFMAFQGDITRVSSLMTGRDATSMTLPDSGFDGPWHGTSHHSDNPENKANYAKMNRYHVRNLAYFVEKMHNTPEGDGTMLDHVLIYKGSNMGNSHRHAHEKVPSELVGGASGLLKGNRHFVFPDNTQRTSNLLLAILHLYGINLDGLGDSTQVLPIV